MVVKLGDSWEGPYIVEKKLSAVNYLIEEVDGRKRSKNVHVNMTKKFKDSFLSVCTFSCC